MASQIIELAGDIVKSINPSLLSSPPPSIEESGRDVCYLGPNGEDDHQHVIYCKDLPAGQRGMVGSWYIHPERHVIEFVAFVTISSIIVLRLLPNLSRYPEKKAGNLNPPLFIKATTLFFFTCQIVYKSTGYPGKILFMAMPCNILWTIWAALCFLPLTTQMMHIMYQLIIPFTSLAVVALATPDTADLTMWMEVPFFFLMHYALVLYPIYFLRSGRISVLSSNVEDGMVSNFLKWWTLACAYFALFYFGVAAPLSLKYGINLNYMLSPPPTPGDMISGPNFRVQSTLYCAAAFFFYSFLVTVAAVFGTTGKTSSAPKKSL
ncbi:hypothetical protein ACHAXR_007904 [Thalassiosira sp. AJA248-18]